MHAHCGGWTGYVIGVVVILSSTQASIMHNGLNTEVKNDCIFLPRGWMFEWCACSRNKPRQPFSRESNLFFLKDVNMISFYFC